MKTVYVLGSGASKASKNTFKGVANPIDSDFFNRSNNIDWNSADKDDKVFPLNKFIALRKYIKLFFNIDLLTSSDVNNLSLEEVFSSIEHHLSWVRYLEHGIDYIDQKEEYSGNDSSLLRNLLNNKDDIVSTLKSYSFWPQIEDANTMALFEGFFRLAEKELKILIYNVYYLINKGMSCDTHNKLVNIINADDSIISFNYDLIIDTALLASKKWNPNTGYYFRIHKRSLFEATPERINISLFWYCNEDFSRSFVPLLKLHGSLNWFKITEESPNHGKQHMYFIEPDLIHPNNTVEYCGFMFQSIKQPEEEDYRIGKNSLAIIPPIVNKRKEFDPLSKFEIIWGKALADLIVADKIVFIGYSLPPTDYHAKWLFSLGYNLNKKRDKLIIQIVNPDPNNEVELKLKQIYRESNFEPKIKGFEDFVNK